MLSTRFSWKNEAVFCLLLCALYCPFASSVATPSTPATAAAHQRQSNITHATEQIEYTIIELNLEPFKGLRHHLLIYHVIDLIKVARAEI